MHGRSYEQKTNYYSSILKIHYLNYYGSLNLLSNLILHTNTIGALINMIVLRKNVFQPGAIVFYVVLMQLNLLPIEDMKSKCQIIVLLVPFMKFKLKKEMT